MKILKLTASGIKGGSFSHELAPVTIFSGPFGSGKTARLDALCLGLLGYSPRLGKRPGDSFRLASGASMKVKLALEGGGAIERRWERDNGSVKFTGPKDASVPAVLLDYREFFALTGPERLGMLASKMDVERLGFKVEGISGHMLKAIDEGCPDLDQMFHGAINNELALMSQALDKARIEEGASVQEWIESFLAQVQVKLKAANDAVKNLTGAARSTVQLSGVSGNVPRDTGAEIQAAEGELQRCRKIRGDWDALSEAIRSQELGIQGIKSNAARSAQIEAAVAGTRKEIEGLQKTADAWRPSNIGKDLAAAQAKAATAKSALNALEESIALGQSEHQKKMRLKCCPTCKRAGKGWQEDIIKEFEEASKELEASRITLEREAATARRHYLDIKAEFDADQRNAKVATEARDRMERLRSVLVAHERDMEAVTSNQNHLSILTAQRDSTKAKLTEGSEDASAASDMITHLQSKIATLRSERDRWISMKSEEKTQARAQTQLRTESDRAAVFKVAVKALQGIQGELIARSMVALLEPANKLTAGFLPGPFEYQEGDFGYRTEAGQWVSHSTFCGTEEAVAYAGLSVALAQESSCKIVLLDGLDIDPAGKQALYIRLVELVKAGVLDQVCATDVTRVCDTVDGMTVIQLGKAAK